MRHLLSICIALLFLGGVSLQAQNGVRGTVSFENVSAKKCQRNRTPKCGRSAGGGSSHGPCSA